MGNTKSKRIIRQFTFGIALVVVLTILASGSYETSMGNTSISGYGNAFDNTSMNLSVNPGDDFYEYAVGNWIQSHPVPMDKSQYGEFEVVEDRTYERVKGIVESAANNTSASEGSLDQKIGVFYRMGMDNATLERQGLDPIKDELKLIEYISNTSEVQNMSSIICVNGIVPFFSVYADTDAKNSKVMIATLSQGGLGLPDRDFYFKQDNESIKTREQYLAHITKMFVYLGENQETAEKNATTVMRIETRLANASFNNVDNNDVVKTYNKMSLQELQEFAPGMNWSCFFHNLGRPDITEVNVRNPSFFKELSNALMEENVSDWQAFMRWKLISATAPYLSPELEEEQFDFYGRKLSGQQEMAPRWKRVLDTENVVIGEVIGSVYVDKYFDPKSKARTEEMVSNLKEAYRERIQNLTWMEPETKKKALMKLEAVDVQVGYPDEWLNYSELEIKNDSYVENVLRASDFLFFHGPNGLDKIGKPVNRKLWAMNPQEVNAYADYTKLVMVFPAGILQPPFYNKDADDAVNYGAIGAVIGHEMIHLFDNQGRKFDSSGNMTDWWTQTDAENFNKSITVLVDQYNKYEVLPGLYINGNQTLSENIADFGGMTTGYHAYNLSLKEEPKTIDGFTGDQRFFLSWAQIWRESQTNESLRLQTLLDTHSPAKFRVNGVVYNVPEFYRAFPNVKPGDKLYRSESERPVIW